MISIVKSAVKSLFPASLLQFRTAQPDAVCLTFDDGPHENTQRLLDILGEAGIQATFFINGTHLKKHEAALLKMVKAGHRIGNHFFDHVSARKISASEMRDQIERLEREVETLTGVKVEIIRPPYGHWNLNLLLYAVKNRRRIVLWSLDSLDGDPRTSDRESIRRNVEAVRGGDILLMHDDNAQTVEALPEIIERIRAKGLKFSQPAASG
jgi:peptidoglycan-N-acetylglucosamine deacetylase